MSLFFLQKLESDQLFEMIAARVSSDPSLVKKVKAVFLWNITKDGKAASQWSKFISHPKYSFEKENAVKPVFSILIMAM